MTIRSFSYGGGVQSTAALVLAAQGRIDFPLFVFANVGDDSEHPATLAYLEHVAHPYAAEHGIELVEVHRAWRDGRVDTLKSHITRPEGRAINIPIRGENGAPGKRACTADFKIGPIAKLLTVRGASPDDPAVVGIGISVDEIGRASGATSPRPHERIVYPLIDLRLSRDQCAQVIRDAGLPVPHKSSCFFCPFHSTEVWAEMRRDTPDLFWETVELEQWLNARQVRFGKRPVYFSRRARPLDQAVAEAQTPLFGDLDEPETCDAFSCFT